MEITNSENSVIWASVQLFPDLPRGCLTDLSLQLCSNWESQKKGSVGVEMILLSLTVPLFASILYVCTFSDTSHLGNTITAISSESGQWFDARVAIIRLLHLHVQICKTSLALVTFIYDTFQKNLTHRGHSRTRLSMLLWMLNILSTSDQSCFYTSTMHR